MKKRSLPLVLALVASTSMIVNCQKTPSKRSATTTNGGVGAQDSATAESAKTAADLKITEECTVEIKNLRKDLFDKMTKFNSQFMDKKVADLSESEKAQLTTDSKTIVDNCGTFIEKLKSVNGAGCKDSDNKNSPLLVKDKAQMYCEKNGTNLKNLTGQENELARADQARKTKEGEEKAIEKFKKETLVLSQEGRALMTSGGVQWKSFLDMGEIKTSKTELEKLVKDGTTVCSFEKEMDFSDTKTAEFQFNLVDENAKNPDGSYFQVVPENYENTRSDKAGSVVLTFSRQNSGDDSSDLNSLVCVNVKKEKITVQKIKQILGKVLKSGAVDKDKDQQTASGTVTAATTTETAPAKPASETVTVTVVKQGSSSSPEAASGQKVTSADLTVVSIDVEGTQYQIIKLSNGQKVKVESGKISLKAASAGQSGTVVKIEEKDGKKYLVDKERQQSALIIEEKDLKSAAKTETGPVKAAKPAQAASAAAPATAASGAQSTTVTDQQTGMKISTTLSISDKAKAESDDQKIALNEKDIQALRAKLVGLKGKTELLKLISISYDKDTRTQKITLNDETILTVETSKIIDVALINSIVKIEYDPNQKIEKDALTGKNKLVGILYLSTGEAIKVTWLKDAKK